MWVLQRTESLARRLKKFEKKHHREIAAVFQNLDTYLVSLNQGVKPLQMFRHGFVHNEQQGIHAIDQSPLRKGFKPCRLYVYPDEATSVLYVVTLGGKDEQSADVRECCDYVNGLRASAASSPAPSPEEPRRQTPVEDVE